MLFYLALKNIVSRKSSVVIILFIAFALTLMTVINAVFDSTENGVEKVFGRSFTGDFVIRPKSNSPLSLFGDETPVLGEMTNIETLIPFSELKDYLRDKNANPFISKIVPQVSGRVAMEFADEKDAVNLFGVPCDTYLDSMTSIEIIDGKSFGDNERGVLLSESVSRRFGAKTGDTVQFIVADGTTFRIRAAKVAGIYKYPVENDTLNRIVLADSYTVRSLMGMGAGVDASELVDEDKMDLLDEDFESMFDDAEDVSAVFVDEEEFLRSETMEKEISASDFSESTSWNFIVGTCENEKFIKNTVRKLNRHFKKNSWPMEAVMWRSAAGSTAMYLYFLRIIFNVGVIVILAAGFIIINNTLVVGVLNRTQEIGTLRAEGASRLFVSMQCMAETFMLTITAGVLGCLAGSVISYLLSMARIELENSFLIQLFGTNVLSVCASLSVLARSIALSVILGLVGWVYPVRTALGVSPVQAMQGVS